MNVPITKDTFFGVFKQFGGEPDVAEEEPYMTSLLIKEPWMEDRVENLN